MMKRLLSLFLITCASVAYAQQGSVRGTVKDAQNGEVIPSAVVSVMSGEEKVATGLADFDGNFVINPVPPGTYTIQVQSLGYQVYKVSGVLVSPNKPTVIDVKLSSEQTMLGEVEVVWEKPLVEKGKTSTIVTQDEIRNLPIRDIGGIAAQTAGVYQADQGGGINFRGGRESANQQFIDGVKVRGNVNLPRDAIQQTEVITGGLPAQYGDVTGGVINTTTRGPQPNYFGSVEYQTSMPFDDWNYNLVNVTAGGPLYKKKDDKGNERTIVGFLLSTDFQFEDDPRPLSMPVYVVKDDVLSSLEQNPNRPGFGGLGTLSNAEFLTNDDLTTQQARNDVGRQELRVNGNISIKTSRTTNLTFGGSYNYVNQDFANSRGDWLMNWNNNLQTIRNDWYVFGRFQQSFGPQGEDAKNAVLKNAFYTLQVDYQRNAGTTWDRTHQDDFFRYGHVGRFETKQARVYAFGQEENTGLTGWIHQAFADTAVLFTPSPYNPIRSRYTSNYYDYVNQGLIANTTNSLIDIQQGGALINGQNPNSVYNGLWSNVGALQGSYSTFRNSQFRVTANSTFDIKNHSLKVGFEYEQRFDRGYSLGANGLWILMRNLQNQAILQLDLDNPNPVYRNGVFMDTINYNRAFDPTVARTFDANVRTKLGLNPNGTDWLDIDKLQPDFFSLDMFSANELLNIGGTQYVSYYGYDYLGNVLDSRPSLGDFFDPNKRSIGAFQPTYIAGYIQDQFTFNDLFFNIGVRVDYFDANQQVLKDPYVLYPTYTVGELAGSPLANELGNVPENIGDDYVVYVDNLENPRAIVGYRSGNQWYNADGSEQSNPREIANISGGIQPFLKSPDQQSLQQTYEQSFVDYDPQVTVSPRVSFQFPISDEAEFFAHYDLLVQRPDPGLNRMNPLDYLLLENQALNNAFIANPNLRPQKTTDYEIGFQQLLGDRSALKISAFYREMRDMMQTVSLNEAYPITYVTYGNQDFGTVKGFSLGYELQRTGNVRMSANYTLQFADGSGSGPNSGANLARSGQPNLRYILPLDYDSRHQLFLNFDFRYRDGADYNGPTWFNSQIFANAGVNLLVNASSGTPYSRRQFAYPLTSAASTSLLDGQINGSRLPWNVRLDLTVNKVWTVKLNKESKKTQDFEVYLQVQNLLNTQNVLNVYPYTGDPEDDGYLSSPQGQVAVNFQTNAQSYIDLYNIRMQNPFNYSLPRRFRLGVRFMF